MSLKSDLKALKALGRMPRSEEERQNPFAGLDKESDIGVALICSSLVEEATEQALLNCMVTLSSEQRGELFRNMGPLATVSARVKLAYALGIFGPKTRKNLGLLRDIRNAVAHSRKPLSFATKEIATVCGHLNLDALSSGAMPKIEDPRARYIWVSLAIWVILIIPRRDASIIQRSPLLP